MSILNLVLYPDDPLMKVAAPVETFGPELVLLAENMFETMHVHEGVGLAGPQVGLSKRILVCHEPEADKERVCLVNPEIFDAEGEAVDEEGCLSFPEIYAPVSRATRIRVRAFDPAGKPLDFEARDFLARIIQHETDHLEGICFVDRLDILTRQATLHKWQEMRQALVGTALSRD